MKTFLYDLRFAFRMLTKNLGFTSIAVLSLALGIGSCTAVFSLVNAVLLSSLPVPNPHELRVLEWSGGGARFSVSGSCTEESPGRFIGNAVSFPIYENLRERCAEQADVFCYTDLRMITGRAQNQSFAANGMVVSGNFFSTLGAKPLLGQLFEPDDREALNARGVVISYPWLERHFGLNANVVGESILLQGHSFTILGVLPSGFPGIHPGDACEFYVSMDALPQVAPHFANTDANHWWVQLMARKKPGVNDSQFQAAFDVAFANAADEQLTEPKMKIINGAAGPISQKNFYRKPLLLLLGVVGVVILIACANLAGLSLARGAVRQHEFAIRTAIGAGRWRLVRQVLTESLLLSILGGGLGIVFALWGKDVISRLMAGTSEGLHYDASLDLRVLFFTLVVMVFTAVLSGLLPAIRAARVDPLSGMKVRSVLGAMRMRSGRLLVIAQVALSLLLLVGAGLYVRTIVNIVDINPGFRMDNILLLQVSPGNAGYEQEKRTAYYDQAQTELAAIPGVQSAAITQFALLGGWMSGGGFFTLPDNPPEDGARPKAHKLTVSESFFETMNVPIKIGRPFTITDVEGAPKSIIVNETFVNSYLKDVHPIGQTLRSNEVDWNIIGVCSDAKYTDIKGEIPPTVYYTFRQSDLHQGYFALRTALPPSGISAAARKAMAAVDPNVPIVSMITQKQVRDKRIAQEWMFAILCSSLAFLAVLLSCIGLYGLMAYNVARRTSEIGVRMALGATRRQIAWPILRSAISMSVVGVLIGGVCALALTRLIRSQLYGVEPHDPITMTLSVITILLVAILAAWIPARRAAKVDPMDALRCE